MLNRPIVRQFIKFCMVGGLSFVIDAGLHYLLMFVIPVGGRPVGVAVGEWLMSLGIGSGAKSTDVSFPFLKAFTASIATLNGFFWNRRWTFRITDHAARHRQLVAYFMVALIGMGLNTVVSSSLNAVIPGHPKRSWAIATILATIVVSVYNFIGQKYFTFRPRPA